MAPTSICVPERGELELDLGQWSKLRDEPMFWALVERGLIKVAQKGPEMVKLIGGAFVGRASAGEVDIFLVEKVQGALPALLGFATGAAFQIERAPSPASELGPLAALLIEQFLLAVRRYASSGCDWRYERTKETGSLIGGRIDLTRSLKLRARGLCHVIAFERPVRSVATPVNRMVGAALAEVERIGDAISLQQGLLATARGLSALFSAARDAETVFGERLALARTAERLSTESKLLVVADMLALAAVILSHESFECAGVLPTRVPRAWFLNLEVLFETAVRRVLSTVLGSSVRVANGKDDAPAIFSGSSGEFTANPDLVLYYGARVAAVGDVKYKNWEGTAQGADLYQLLAHTAAHGSRIGFLVYPGDSFAGRDLGFSGDGIRTFLFSVDPAHLAEHLALAVKTMRTLQASERLEHAG